MNYGENCYIVEIASNHNLWIPPPINVLNFRYLELESIFAPFYLAPFTPVQYIDDRQVEKLNPMAAVKRIKNKPSRMVRPSLIISSTPLPLSSHLLYYRFCSDFSLTIATFVAAGGFVLLTIILPLRFGIGSRNSKRKTKQFHLCEFPYIFILKL
jgi:hypothetical protein